MSETANLKIPLINGSDYVSPEPINEGFKKVDAIALDYVVASGYSGEWWYRKWHSGRMECGIDCKNFGNVPHTTPWSGLGYTSGPLSFKSYPFAFSQNPMAVISFLGTSDGSHVSYVSMKQGTTTVSPTFYLADPNSNTARECKFGIYACGRYK